MTVSAPRPVRVLGVSSGKGGVGKTNVCVNLGVALTRLGRRVTLLDADLGLANVDVLLGLKPVHTLEHVLSGECRLADVMLEIPCGMRVVPASSGVRGMAALGPQGQAGIISAFNAEANDMDVLLVDTAAGISSDVLGFLAAAQEVLVVVCNEPTSITDAYALVKVLNQTHGIDRFRIVVNMVAAGDTGQSVFDKLRRVTDRFLDVCLDYSGAVPMDPQLRKAVSRQRAVVDAFPHSESARAFDALARRVERWPMPGGARGHLEFFVENLVASSRPV